jgi:hypothetical protein
MRARSETTPIGRIQRLSRTYKTPFAMLVVFAGLLLVFAFVPTKGNVSARGPITSAEPTPGPHECVVCGVDKTCDARTGQCIFIDHTPLPCVESAKYDDKAGFCLPEGVPAAPAQQIAPADGVRPPSTPRPPRLRQPRRAGSTGTTVIDRSR